MTGSLLCLRHRFAALPHNAKRRGSFATEFALLSVPFFLLMMGIIELCLIEGAQQLLESAAYNTSRLAKTGYVAEGQTQGQTVQAILVQELSSYGFLFDTSNIVTTQTTYSSFSGASGGGGASGYGTASQIVAYTITYPWKVFTPLMCQALGGLCTPTEDGNVLTLTSTIVVRNEPYS